MKSCKDGLCDMGRTVKTHMEKADELYATKHMAIQKFYSKFYS